MPSPQKSRQGIIATTLRVIGQWLHSDYRREAAPNPHNLPDNVN